MITLNIQAQTVDKIDDMNRRFYKELEHVFENSLTTIWKFCYDILCQSG
jgi:hypothetical protein